jgi:asparagine synthase (glutamine-hydrolysing)
MCGFCGLLVTNPAETEEHLRDVVGAMSRTQSHRGPDCSSTWVDAAAGVGLGHERLSILDLSPTGNQPMHSGSNRFVIAFNGEIYNHGDLRAELSGRGQRFRGTSDTEVLIAGFEEWGIADTLRRCVGMFAFGVWDRTTRRLTLARDRAGEKPLFYGWQGGTFLCGSELKSLRAHPDFRAEVDRDALTLYLRFNYVPSPHSIFRGIRKLTPGTFLTIDPGSPGTLPDPIPYWSLEAAATAGAASPIRDEQTAADELDALLRGAVRSQMIADVPVGAFLSGGIDSSLIVGAMQAESSRPIKTFTIGYAEKEYDEAAFAAAVARHLGTEHTELRVTPDEALAVIPELPSMYDEPFADSSQIPTHLVSRLARTKVTVALSGDAADELFGGYDRYPLGARIWRTMRRIPRPLRHLIADSAQSLRPGTLDWIDDMTSRVRGRPAGRSRSRERITKFGDVLRATDAGAVYSALSSIWPRPEEVVIGGREPTTVAARLNRAVPARPLEERMMYMDFLTYLPDDILAKVDRASMAVSLETRAPFLDHRIIEFAYRLPLDLKIRGPVRKHLLRVVLSRYVPTALVDRPKMGFAVPVGRWLRGPLRHWAEELLAEDRLRDGGYFAAAPIRRLWTEHQAGRVDASFALWGVLMFEAWRGHD